MLRPVDDSVKGCIAGGKNVSEGYAPGALFHKYGDAQQWCSSAGKVEQGYGRAAVIEVLKMEVLKEEVLKEEKCTNRC